MSWPQGHDLVGINRKVSNVVAKWSEADSIIFVEVALPEFQQASEWTENFEIFGDRLAGKRIQNNIHSFAKSAGSLSGCHGASQRPSPSDCDHPNANSFASRNHQSRKSHRGRTSGRQRRIEFFRNSRRAIKLPLILQSLPSRGSDTDNHRGG